jgi:hypothetical protein
MYDTSIGRFTTMDTWDGINSDPITLNKYLYAGADPVNNRDPSGHDFLVDLSISAGIGALLGGITLGSVSKAYGGSFWVGFGQGALLGSETAAALFLANATGRPPQVLAGAFINGLTNVAVDATAAAALGKPEPDAQVLTLDFSQGFANGAASGTFKGIFAGPVNSFAVTGVVSFISTEIHNIDTNNPTSIGDAFQNALVSAAISSVISLSVEANEVKTGLAQNFIETNPTVARSIVNAAVGGIAGWGIGTLEKVIKGLHSV